MPYWLQNPSYVLLGRRSTPDLPHTADVIVVGSGITGAFAARELVAKGRSVLMLEAREACWGATGRVSFLIS
jgi:glycine/D-amino acid oxidase-like deaminating enzyme